MNKGKSLAVTAALLVAYVTVGGIIGYALRGALPTLTVTGERGAVYVSCGEEDGGPVLPCVWDAALQGNGRWGEDGTRWYLYVRIEDGCPPALPAELVTCRVVS